VNRAVVGALAALQVTLAAANWHTLAGVVLSVLIVVVAGCWVIADPDRARRLATLIRAWRK
jgi:hypothetical protein